MIFDKKIFINPNGQVAILFVFIFIVLCGFCGFVIDGGQMIYQKQKLQDGLDLAALAVVHETLKSNGQVVSTAVNFAKKNGIDPGELMINYPYNGDSNKVELIANREINFAFFSLFGYKSKTISARAVAAIAKKTLSGYTYQAFDYAVFNGSNTTELAMKGSGSTVNGNVHSNSAISVLGMKHKINGNVTAGGTISLGKTTVTGTVTPSSPYVPIPVLDFNEYASMAAQVFNEDVTLNGDISIDGVWLINGRCHISGLRVSGSGIILATNGIQISGSLEYSSYPTMVLIAGQSSPTYLNYGDILALYSLSDIQISGVNAKIDGVLYAPNGMIRVDGSGNTFNGALIADQVVWATNEITINGSYDLRVPQAFTVEEDVIRLEE